MAPPDPDAPGDPADRSAVDWSDLDGSVLDEYILGAPREFTQADLVERTGHDGDEAHRLWRALGFPDPGPDEQVFTRFDVEAAQAVARLSEQ